MDFTGQFSHTRFKRSRKVLDITHKLAAIFNAISPSTDLSERIKAFWTPLAQGESWIETALGRSTKGQFSSPNAHIGSFRIGKGAYVMFKNNSSFK